MLEYLGRDERKLECFHCRGQARVHEMLDGVVAFFVGEGVHDGNASLGQPAPQIREFARRPVRVDGALDRVRARAVLCVVDDEDGNAFDSDGPRQLQVHSGILKVRGPIWVIAASEPRKDDAFTGKEHHLRFSVRRVDTRHQGLNDAHLLECHLNLHGVSDLSFREGECDIRQRCEAGIDI